MHRRLFFEDSFVFILEEVTQETQDVLGVTFQPQPAVQEVVDEILAELCAGSPWLRHFAEALQEQTGERLLRRIDHLSLSSQRYGAWLEEAGFSLDPAGGGEPWARRPDAFVPALHLHEAAQSRCVLRVESVAEFVRRYPGADPSWDVEGPEGAPLRRCLLASGPEVEVWLAERWGSTGWQLDDRSEEQRELARLCLDAFRARARDEAGGAPKAVEARFETLRELIVEGIRTLGEDWTCALFFRAEREHWLSKTPAAQVQGRRLDAWGLGWAHHDHHTYRCSRRWLRDAVAVLELLGLRPREAFHAGAEAGWGAQVLEHPRLPFVTFVDVDLSPKELRLDFAHQGLPARDSLGTVGLWCGLHGEAMVGAGLHHLACHCDFDAMTSQLRDLGIEVMPPFADLPELRQAFTVADLRPVRPERIQRLQSAGLITETEARSFRENGALGSHIELIERKEAYKGFHQKGISQIITHTRPGGGHYPPS